MEFLEVSKVMNKTLLSSPGLGSCNKNLRRNES